MSEVIRFLRFPFFTAAILAWSAPVLGTTMEAAIKRDPFQSPKRTGGFQETGSSADPDGTAQGDPAANSPQANLRAIIYDPKKSMVNIGGQIIEVGGSLQGYTLMNVGEREATLMKNGKPVKVNIDGVTGR